MDAAITVTIITWIAMAVRMSTPLLITSLGGLLAQKSGIFNFALEGMMLSGAFFAYYGSLIGGSPWMGLLFAIFNGIIIGLVLAFASTHLGVSQLVIGIGLNIFCLGLTSYLYRILDNQSGTNEVVNFQNINIPGLSNLPIIGPILFQYNWMIYAGILVTIVIALFLNKTSTGLNLRAVGENPLMADTAGVSVFKYRYLATIISGVLASLGGAFLTLTQVSRFVENMSAGRGWIALAAIILGKYNPWGVLAACILFGAADALQMQAQILNVQIPYQVLMMTPYLLAMLAMAGLVGKVHAPAAQGKPYIKH